MQLVIRNSPIASGQGRNGASGHPRGQTQQSVLRRDGATPDIAVALPRHAPYNGRQAARNVQLLASGDATVFRLTIALLGPPRVECDGQPLRVDTRKAIALVAFLAVTGE